MKVWTNKEIEEVLENFLSIEIDEKEREFTLPILTDIMNLMEKDFPTVAPEQNLQYALHISMYYNKKEY